MKGRVSGNRKRLAAFAREVYIIRRRGIFFLLSKDKAQAGRDWRSHKRRMRLAAFGFRFSHFVAGQP